MVKRVEKRVWLGYTRFYRVNPSSDTPHRRLRSELKGVLECLGITRRTGVLEIKFSVYRFRLTWYLYVPIKKDDVL